MSPAEVSAMQVLYQHLLVQRQEKLTSKWPFLLLMTFLSIFSNLSMAVPLFQWKLSSSLEQKDVF